MATAEDAGPQDAGMFYRTTLRSPRKVTEVSAKKGTARTLKIDKLKGSRQRHELDASRIHSGLLGRRACAPPHWR